MIAFVDLAGVMDYRLVRVTDGSDESDPGSCPVVSLQGGSPPGSEVQICSWR